MTPSASLKASGKARDDHTELRRRHIQTLRHILADQHFLLADMLSQLFRLNDSFDPFQMGRKALAPTRCTLAIRFRTALADLGPDGEISVLCTSEASLPYLRMSKASWKERQSCQLFH